VLNGVKCLSAVVVVLRGDRCARLFLNRAEDLCFLLEHARDSVYVVQVTRVSCDVYACVRCYEVASGGRCRSLDRR